MKPTLVEVHDSDSSIFPGLEQTYPFKEFESLALMAAMLNSDHEITNFTLHFDDRSKFSAEMCLGTQCTFGLQDFFGRLKEEPDMLEDPVALKFLHEIEFITH